MPPDLQRLADQPVDALVRVPGSKSLTARWMLLAAAAQAWSVDAAMLRTRNGVVNGPVGRQVMDKLEEKGLVGLVKYTTYDSDDKARTVDTDKVWLQLQYSL